MTNKERIKEILGVFTEGLTCQVITSMIKESTRSESKYLSGSISSILRKMVKDDIIEVDKDNKGPKGGNIYKLKNV